MFCSLGRFLLAVYNVFAWLIICCLTVGYLTPEIFVLDSKGNQKVSDHVSVTYRSHLTLICRTASTEEPLFWKYSPFGINRFEPVNQTSHITLESTRNGETSLKFATIRFFSSGVYQCANSISSRQVNIHVYGVLYTVSDSVRLIKKAEVIGTIHLEINVIDPNYVPVVACRFRVGPNGIKFAAIRWKGGKFHENPSLYKVTTFEDVITGVIWTNLTLLHPSHDQTLYGKYYCMLSVVTGSVEVGEVNISMPPLVQKPDRSVSPYSGENFSYLCDVVAYPLIQQPIAWARNEVRILVNSDGSLNIPGYDAGNRVRLETSKVPNDRIVFDPIGPDDRAVYSCFVEGVLGNDTGAFFLRVKDWRAPLWPLIGIILELLVLFSVICVYEIRRRGKAKQDKEVDEDLGLPTKQLNIAHGSTLGEDMLLRQRSSHA